MLPPLLWHGLGVRSSRMCSCQTSMCLHYIPSCQHSCTCFLNMSPTSVVRPVCNWLNSLLMLHAVGCLWRQQLPCLVNTAGNLSSICVPYVSPWQKVLIPLMPRSCQQPKSSVHRFCTHHLQTCLADVTAYMVAQGVASVTLLRASGPFVSDTSISCCSVAWPC
jgi:hypothetical protein